MVTGTKNEDPTVDKLRNENFIVALYDIGLLGDKNNRYIGVSPDGIAILKLPYDINGDVVSRTQFACVEIKTRVADSTITIANKALAKHDRFVRCNYGDIVFKDCVPHNNCIQVIHQACASKFNTGMFVTAKVEEEEGSIVQIVVVSFTDNDLETYKSTVYPLEE